MSPPEELRLTFLSRSPAVVRFAARARSAVRCTGWRTATCGAPPAAGRKPARDSPTEPTASSTATACYANRLCSLLPQTEGRGVTLHAFGFPQLKQKKKVNCLSSSGPAPSNSSYPFLLRKLPEDDTRSPFIVLSRIPSSASPFP